MLAEPKRRISDHRLAAVMQARDERLKSLREATARLERISNEPAGEDQVSDPEVTKRTKPVLVAKK